MGECLANTFWPMLLSTTRIRLLLLNGIIQHVLVLHLAFLCVRYWTSAGLKTRETSCPRIDGSVSNIPIPWPCLWPLVCPVGLWHQTSHHMLLPQCSRLVWSNHHFVTTNPIISSQPNSLRTSSGWSGDNPRIVIICIKRRKDQHENRKHPWDKVLRVVRGTVWSQISHHTSSLNIFSHCQKKCQEKSHLGEWCLSAVLNYSHWPVGHSSWMMGFGGTNNNSIFFPFLPRRLTQWFISEMNRPTWKIRPQASLPRWIYDSVFPFPCCKRP